MDDRITTLAGTLVNTSQLETLENSISTNYLKKNVSQSVTGAITFGNKVTITGANASLTVSKPATFTSDVKVPLSNTTGNAVQLSQALDTTSTDNVYKGGIRLGLLIINWGRIKVTSTGNDTVYFKVPFSNTGYAIVKNYRSNDDEEITDREISFWSKEIDKAVTYNNSSRTSYYEYIAIGR